MIATWTSEQFHMEREEGAEPSPSGTKAPVQYESLQQALDEYGVEEKLAPTQLPDQATLVSITPEEEKGALTFLAVYEVPNGVFSITIRQTSTLPVLEIEKDATNVESYFVDGIEHHLMEDLGRQKAIWHNNGWECRINGDISRNELTAMIDSIYK